MVLVITGSPGVGKHTIANEILHSNDYELLDINKIASEKGFIEDNQDGNEIDVDKFKGYFGKIITEKSLVVGHLAPYVLNDKNVTLINDSNLGFKNLFADLGIFLIEK